MLRKLLPRASSEQLLQVGTDLSLEGRFRDTLSYNHYTREDETNLKALAELLEPSLEEAADLLHGYVNHLLDHGGSHIERQTCLNYLRTFLHEPRTEQYAERILPFFHELRLKGCNVGKLLVVLNQIRFFFFTHVWSSRKLFPQRCLELMGTLQRAGNIDQQMLIEAFTENLMETAADGVTRIMGKVSDIMYIKDLLAMLEEQSDLSQSVAAASEQLTASIDEVVRNVTDAAEKADDAAKDAESGKQIISLALNEIVRSNETFDQMVSSFQQLKNFLGNIRQIAGLIDNIARDTHLLALNASIEAARAGQAGNGFKVVADEIRKLADSTMHSLKAVNDNVEEVSRLSESVSESIHATRNVIKRGVKEAEEALPILDKITNQTAHVSASTETIAAITEEQAAAVNDVTHRIIQAAELTNDVRDLSTQTGHAVYELSKTTQSFRNAIFSTNIRLSTKALLQVAKSDHVLWKWRIYSMIMGYEKVEPDEVSSHHHCRLGKWYFSQDTVNRFRTSKSYQQMDKPHQLVHEHARLAAEAYNKGDTRLAEEHLSSLEQASRQVIQLIDELISDMSEE